MKKRILLFVAIIAVIICAFAMSVNADEVECTEHIPVWTVNVGANGFLGDITSQLFKIDSLGNGNFVVSCCSQQFCNPQGSWQG